MARSNLITRFILLIALSWAGMLFASPANIAVVLSDESAPYQDTAGSLRATLAQSGAKAVVSVYPQSDRKIDFLRESPDLIVTIGVSAAQELAAQNLPIPILAVLIPRQAFEKIARQRDFRFLSAVFLDQPLARQMELVRLATPDRSRVGVVLGPESQAGLKSLQAAASEAKLGLAVERISTAEELLPALQRVLADSDVLLAVPDPLVFNKGTVQSLLLTTYRYQDPVIGFSHAYVKAGALASVHTMPEQVGRQAADVILRTLGSRPAWLPPPENPKYFSVSVNYQVARSLGLSIGDETVLLQKLKRASESQ
ncbi:MAG: ABC transporter substrate binding protein [Sulfurimicrobium sp.]|nr:ABC transporter substrate binding protein [Sulfurimicrobium sp.]